MKKNRVFKGFTLAEVLVCLAVVSVLATILIPTLGKIQPNKNKTMFKKAYQITERVIYELVNDATLYPEVEGVHGFDNLKRVSFNNTNYGSDTLNSDEALCKFTNLFAEKLNTLSDSPACGNYTWTDGSLISSASRSIVSTDGIFWALPKTNFTAGESAAPAYKKIMIDVNGDKQPNKMDSEDASAVCSGDVDRFTLYVRSDGIVRVKGVCAREYLNDINLINSTLSNKSNSSLGASGDTSITVSNDGTAHDGGNVDDDEADFAGDVGNYNPNLEVSE